MKNQNPVITWSSPVDGYISSLQIGNYKLSFNPDGSPYRFESYSGVVKIYSKKRLQMITVPGTGYVINTFYNLDGDIELNLIRDKGTSVRLNTRISEASQINLSDYKQCFFSDDEAANLREIFALMGTLIQNDPHQPLHDCLMAVFEAGLTPF